MNACRALFALLLAAVVLAPAPTPAQPKAEPPAPPTALTDYVGREDKSFAWKLADKSVSDAGTVYTIDLVSQTWHDIKWEHKLQVFVPAGTTPQKTMMLWNQGGRPGPTSALLGLELAKRVGAPVAFLFGVPNQPLFEGKTEDALIAETFVRYLDTKDASWPLLFPMVKSVIRAMDALQAFAREHLGVELAGFVVTGASKRGWTSWLTAATGDPRVKAIAPLVIDTLNFPVQTRNQVAAFGRPSEMVRDYTNRGLIPIPNTPEATQLWQMVDPWVYRSRVRVPKLIINGTNDPYWPLDALNTYWDDLQGEKYLLYVPNAGHDLRETDKDGKKELLPQRAVNALSAFTKAQVFGKAMPKLTWKYTPTEQGVHVSAAVEGTVKSQRAWFAYNDTRDFRKARWAEQVTQKTEGGARVEISGPVSTGMGFSSPSKGLRAVYLETEFEVDGVPCPLTTQLRILDAKK
ncbi:MAG TPA: PhoPQ-activated protein PqaA family protein [Urbifossiella sp.]|nr:PhoPQ-activated protein PqaA family protein [Urbifossiella sp.]